jgi:hypothetical protein
MFEHAEQLCKQKAEKAAEVVDLLEVMTPEQIWLADLKQLSSYLTNKTKHWVLIISACAARSIPCNIRPASWGGEGGWFSHVLLWLHLYHSKYISI